MTWWLWMLAGAVGTGIGSLLVFYLASLNDNRRRNRKLAIASRQRAAERDMQKIVTDTITEMLNAARELPIGRWPA